MVIDKKENLKFWEQPVTEEEKAEQISFENTHLDDAEQVADRTRQLLDEQGYCLWACQILRGETIVLVEDEKLAHLPAPLLKYANYTLPELELIEDLSEKTCRLIHLAKKLGAARVMEVRKTTEGEKAAFQGCNSKP